MPPRDEAVVPLLTEMRDLLKDIRDDQKWLRDKVEAANILGR